MFLLLWQGFYSIGYCFFSLFSLCIMFLTMKGKQYDDMHECMYICTILVGHSALQITYFCAEILLECDSLVRMKKTNVIMQTPFLPYTCKTLQHTYKRSGACIIKVILLFASYPMHGQRCYWDGWDLLSKYQSLMLWSFGK